MIYQYLPFAKERLDAHQCRLVESLENYLDFPTPGFWSIVKSYLFTQSKTDGIYIYGSVGLGKSVICKAYFDAIRLDKSEKIFLHYHELLRQLHKSMHEVQQVRSSIQDIVVYIASKMQYRVMVIDEFEVQDITDAMILYRLFQQLRKNGTFIIMTSNVAPKALYQGGLQRERFLPFISMLEKKFDIVHIDSVYDYRIGKLTAAQERIIYGADADIRLDHVLEDVVPHDILSPVAITIFGRDLKLKRAGHKILLSSFEELCTQDLSYNDYLEICMHFEVIILREVPSLDDNRVNEVIRFVHLVDALYMNKKIFFMSAATSRDNLYTGILRANEFKRTQSRLVEMNSTEYVVAE